jgi:hypothetical protein
MNSKHTPVINFSSLLAGIAIGFISGCLATILIFNIFY